MVAHHLRYDASAALRLYERAQWKSLKDELHTAHSEVLEDAARLHSKQPVPQEKQPLDAAFVDLPTRLIEESLSGGLVARIESAAEQLRNELDRVVLLGIGGSYMGARALFEALGHPYHNELTRQQRGGVPRIHFAGHNLDNDATAGLLELLSAQCTDPNDLLSRWGIVVISKSGGTLETAVAFRLFRNALDNFYGADSEESRRYVVPITGTRGKLRDLAEAKGYEHVFPIPENVGGRFSVFTAVGLLPAALLGLNIQHLLEGAVDMTEWFRKEPLGRNPVLDYVATSHILERDRGLNIRVLATWGARLEALGLWYDQLLAESLGKQQRGATPITAVNTRDLHSRGQQHQQGRRDKLITNVIVQASAREPVELPPSDEDHDVLNQHAGKSLPDFLSAAVEGTNQAYADDDRPTADIVLPRLDEYSLGQLLQMLMLATAVEGRLVGINPYGQPGVEDYKRNMKRILENR